jgi:predicted dienelactone hydrolase
VRKVAAGVLVALALVTAACADDGDGDDLEPADAGPAGPEQTQAEADAARAAYTDFGPYAVGLTTVQLADRQVEVLYPAAEGATAPPGVPPAPTLVGDEVVTREAPASDEGPFPVVLYSHGFAASPLVSATLQAGIASWGFAVAAPDHIERNTAALGRGDPRNDPARDVQTMQEALDGVAAAGEADGPLSGAVDGERVGSAGHSAGGGAALNALRLPAVTATVTWAGVDPTDEPLPEEPVMVLGAEADVAISGDDQRAVYEELPGPKRLVLIQGGTGHATFLDGCPAARRQVIESGQPRGEVSGIVALAFDGCDADDVDPVLAWEVIQHFTVAHLRDALGVDEVPVGLGDRVLDEFPDVPVVYEHSP